MNDSAARFRSPVPATRPRGTRLLEAYSPKLDRRVRFYDHLAFSQWFRLEASANALPASASVRTGVSLISGSNEQTPRRGDLGFVQIVPVSLW